MSWFKCRSIMSIMITQLLTLYFLRCFSNCSAAKLMTFPEGLLQMAGDNTIKAIFWKAIVLNVPSCQLCPRVWLKTSVGSTGVCVGWLSKLPLPMSVSYKGLMEREDKALQHSSLTFSNCCCFSLNREGGCLPRAMGTNRNRREERRKC